MSPSCPLLYFLSGACWDSSHRTCFIQSLTESGSLYRISEHLEHDHLSRALPYMQQKPHCIAGASIAPAATYNECPMDSRMLRSLSNVQVPSPSDCIFIARRLNLSRTTKVLQPLGQDSARLKAVTLCVWQSSRCSAAQQQLGNISSATPQDFNAALNV